ncbi:hypothetical protein QQX98_000396 [Neonectria punicea]|uniref:GS catalytic domain-containing protein n=1 Tax=Neonectria punicea TaxID=979145 RepID=A0ABR1HTQ0_9HYPO
MTVEAPASNGSLPDRSQQVQSIDKVKQLLGNDDKIKVAGINCDGILRGKVMHKSKFLAPRIVELEFMNYQTPTQDGYHDPHGRHNLAAFLSSNSPSALRTLTSGSFGYSASRPIMAKTYFHDIFDMSIKLDCPIEGWHTESGQSVYEAALAVSPWDKMADNVALFKSVPSFLHFGITHGVTPCFMAKPVQGLPGNSGHIHVSLTDLEGTNAFARDTPDPNAAWSDLAYLSNTGRYFRAGVLEALPDIMPLFAPNVNSYKRLIENYCKPSAT